MILTVTLNPAVDVRYFVPNFSVNGVYRPQNLIKEAGGKGINIAKVLKILGANVTATGILGGDNGNWISKELCKLGINDKFSKSSVESRTCIAVISENGVAEILENSSAITNEELDTFEENYKNLIKKAKIITFSGSLMKGMPNNYYKKLIDLANELQIKTILDTSTAFLEMGIKSNPYLIKPNKEELSYFLGYEANSDLDIIKGAKLFQEKGAQNILVSLGENGAIFFYESKIFKINIPKIKIHNAVGSGDATVAGFALGISKKLPWEDSIKLAMACGMSNAQSDRTGFVSPEQVNLFIKEIDIKRI